jgi:hypothetical protein
MSGSQPTAVDVREIMREIRGRTRAASQRRAEIERTAERIISPALNVSLWNLENGIREIRDRAGRIGALPPVPPTLRGRIGALMVAAVQRALFFVLPDLRENQLKIAETLDYQAHALREITAVLRTLSLGQESLRRAVFPEPKS